MRVLLLHYTPRPSAVRLTTEQHLQALERLGQHADVLSYNAVHGAPSWLRRLRFDAVILHTTFLAVRWHTYFERWKQRSAWLAESSAIKIAFPQDEYDHADQLDQWLEELGVSVVCTVLDDRNRGELYPRLGGTAAFYETLTGYIDDASAERYRIRMPSFEARRYDIVYRARHLPYWFGSHGQLKHQIGDETVRRAPAHSLCTDISTRLQETILGDAWLDFLGTGRATIGAESGSSVLDRGGEIRDRIDEILAVEPTLSFEQVSARMPPGWDDYRFFAISPRHLEAVVTKTAQILVEGTYSGAFEAGVHYIPVRRDFADLDEALDQASDPRRLAEVADRAYTDVYESGRYSAARLGDLVEQILSEHVRSSVDRPRRSGFFPAAERAATVESGLERKLVEPVAGVFRAGREGYLELLAGLRLAALDGDSRRLLIDYLRSAETREHVGPREALADILRLAVVRRAQAGKFDGHGAFSITSSLDEEHRRVLLESRKPADDADREGLDRLDELLEQPGWEFYWDHSSVGRAVSYPLLRGRSLELPLPPGPARLRVLDWLARYRPDHVAAALAPLLRR